MRERIDIGEVEAQTKIRAKYLRAIENEEWDLLPGTVYAKSFLRTYGDFLGLDSRVLVDEFRRRYERPSEQEIRPVSRPRRDRDRRPPGPLVPSWVSILLVVVVVVGILAVIGIVSNKSNTSTPSQQTVARHKKVPTTAARTTPRPAPPAKVTLQMVPTNAVYVCLVSGDGNKLINERTYNVGQTIPTEKASKLLLTLGNNNVKMKVDGKAVPVAASPNAIRLLITPATVRPIPLSQPPMCG